MAATKHMPTYTYSTLLLLLLLFIYKASAGGAKNTTEDVVAVIVTAAPVELVPVGTSEYKQMFEMKDMGRRRKLGPFQVCLACRCCVMASDPTTCSNMPCCFGIDCQLPNKPFGVCAFVPKTCNCTTCAASP